MPPNAKSQWQLLTSSVLDLDINDETWNQVGESIRREMDSVVVAEDGVRPMHPRVDVLLPLVASNHCKSVLLEEIERYEQEDSSDMSDDDYDNNNDDDTLPPASGDIGGHDHNHHGIMRRGISYPVSFYNDADEIDYRAIYTALSHSQLENRNLQLLAATKAEIEACQQAYVSHLTNIHEQLRSQTSRKRKETAELEQSRKKRQTEGYGPVEAYLSQRWHDLIRSIVDMGAEMANRDK